MKGTHKELCPHCGASMMINQYDMNRPLMRAMVKLARAPGKPIRDLGMTKSEYANISKLKFWGLAEKSEDGLWYLTDKALKFLAGKTSIDRTVHYFRNRAVKFDGGAVHITAAFEKEESKQKYREMMRPYLGECELG